MGEGGGNREGEVEIEIEDDKIKQQDSDNEAQQLIADLDPVGEPFLWFFPMSKLFLNVVSVLSGIDVVLLIYVTAVLLRKLIISLSSGSSFLEIESSYGEFLAMEYLGFNEVFILGICLGVLQGFLRGLMVAGGSQIGFQAAAKYRDRMLNCKDEQTEMDNTSSVLSATVDLDIIYRYWSSVHFDLVQKRIQIVGSLVFCFLFSWVYSLIILAGVILCFVCVDLIVSRRYAQKQEQLVRLKTGEMNHLMSEIVLLRTKITLSSMLGEELQILSTLERTVLLLLNRLAFVGFFSQLFRNTVMLSTTFFLMFFVKNRDYDGDVGDELFYFLGVFVMTRNLNALMQILGNGKDRQVEFETAKGNLKKRYPKSTPTHTDTTDSDSLDSLPPTQDESAIFPVEFEEVLIQYGRPTGKDDEQDLEMKFVPCFRDLNWKLERGKVYGLVGQTGSGKSTLLKVIAGLISPSEGKVAIQGVDLASLDEGEGSWREGLFYLTQDVLLFTRTLRQNICYGLKRPVGDGELVSALKSVDLLPWFESLPDGFDTMMDTRASIMSGGQRQRLEIARMLLFKDCPLVLLDEPTSALDPTTTRVIMELLLQFLQGKTAVIVTHNVDLLQICDETYEAVNGNISPFVTEKIIEGK